MEGIVTIEGNFLSAVRRAKKNLNESLKRSMKRAASDLEVEIHRTVVDGKLMKIKFEEFKKTKTLMRVTDLSGGIAHMNIVVSVTGKPHTSYRFFPRQVMRGRKKFWAGRIYGELKLFYGGQGFQIPGKKPLFVREGKGRFPIKPVFGPSVPRMLEKIGCVPRLIETAGILLRIRLAETIDEDFFE